MGPTHHFSPHPSLSLSRGVLSSAIPFLSTPHHFSLPSTSSADTGVLRDHCRCRQRRPPALEQSCNHGDGKLQPWVGGAATDACLSCIRRCRADGRELQPVAMGAAAIGGGAATNVWQAASNGAKLHPRVHRCWNCQPSFTCKCCKLKTMVSRPVTPCFEWGVRAAGTGFGNDGEIGRACDDGDVEQRRGAASCGQG
ncbi:uncharacterized protein LOC119289771 [Triticum dicoccoides]|uniref:uncharacterized protein LOC119289771 n=1 Tax=Triticum dicoccoides TaxID=85692 RepID=UPI00188FACE1|nr:uncharacterized protein LOC119289771 [Triticum dicoccoides]